MELKVSSVKQEDLSPADCSSDPEEKEVSDEDDDDRNHKHRRRESRSQSVDRDSLEPVFTRSYRKRNKQFENGHPYRRSDPQASDSWRNNSTTKFEKRHPGSVSLPRAPLDLNPRFRPNQIFPGEHGSGRGRAKDSGSWSQRDSRFSSADIAAQMIQQGPITQNLFNRRGLANVSNAHSASWNTFGLVSGMPNGGLDPIHSIALQGTLRPAINSSLHMGIHRQRCRDFEERGFCLRGDMCPMEHGVNRIVIEDVQSLSQFNLPTAASSTPLMDSQGIYSKTSKAGLEDHTLGLNDVFSSSVGVTGADLYDPDQPLWNKNGPETSTGLSALHLSKNDENESLVNIDPSDHHYFRVRGSMDNGTGIATGSRSTSSSVRGRICTRGDKLDVQAKNDSAVGTADYLNTEIKEDQDALPSSQGTILQAKQITGEGVVPKTLDSSGKIQSDVNRNTRKPSQKALRTLFVNGIPQKSNKWEVLLSHFQKFGEVVDIYIPLNSERAFVQFSKREEAEAALRSPDAVMGNRFIKLWWANRDNIPDEVTSNSSVLSMTSRGMTSVAPPYPPGNGRKDVAQSAIPKATVKATTNTDFSSVASDYPKPVIAYGPKTPPPMQKKLEDLEQLKEELRKKQELLDQKRNDFRRQLVKLEKQSSGIKGDMVTEPAAKRHKVAISADVAGVTTPRSSDSGANVPLTCTEVTVDKSNSVENVISYNDKTNTAGMLQEVKGAKQPINMLAPVPVARSPFPLNRYKLDNRPTAFRIIPSLPAGLANVAALKEHFSSHGDISSVDLEDINPCDEDAGAQEVENGCGARVNFKTRQSAERAFLNGKCWQGHNLKFMWLTSTASNGSGERENSAATKHSQEASASGNEEPVISEKNDGDELTAGHEVSQPVADEKDSPDQEHLQNLASNVEESTEKESSPAPMTG